MDLVKMQTKHKTDAGDRHYASQVSIPVCKVNAGFMKDEKYSVPRSKIGLPGNLSTEELTLILFPFIPRLRNELEQEDGDNCMASRHFLDVILPFFAEVIVQDGIYWLQKHPLNSGTRLLQTLLLNKTGDESYSFWATRKRAVVRNMVQEIAINNENFEEQFRNFRRVQEQQTQSIQLLQQQLHASNQTNEQLLELLLQGNNVSIVSYFIYVIVVVVVLVIADHPH